MRRNSVNVGNSVIICVNQNPCGSDKFPKPGCQRNLEYGGKVPSDMFHVVSACHKLANHSDLKICIVCYLQEHKTLFAYSW